MTQEDYKLWTGETVSYSDEDWSRLVAVASARLASFLCLEELPDELPDDLGMLLGNFIAGVLRFQGTPEASIASKSVRNFSITFASNTAADVYKQLYANYRDLIDRYSACGCTLKVERSARCCDDCL